MRADKMSISLDAGLVDAVRRAARPDGTGLSAWLADAVRAKLRAEALTTSLDAWGQDHGSLTAEELRRAEAELGFVAEAPAVSALVLAPVAPVQARAAAPDAPMQT